MSHRLRVGLLVALVAAALIPAAPAGAAPPTSVTYNLKNDYRDLACLAGRTGVPSSRQVTTSQCVDSYTDQYWQLLPAPVDGYFMLQNRISGLCLGMPQGAMGNKDFAKMDTCGAAYVYWALDPTSLGDTFMLRHYISHKCLVALHTNGSATQFTCTFDYHDQWWHFVQR